MFRDVLPGVANLYCVAGSIPFRGIDVSATGLGDTLAEAITLHSAELAERKASILGPRERSLKPIDELDQAAWIAADRQIREPEIECFAAKDFCTGQKGWFPARMISRSGKPETKIAEGTAAGTSSEMAALNAVREAIERYASRAWWLGHRAAVKPSETAVCHFERYLRQWRRDHDRNSGLLNITPDFGVPVYVAWSCRETGDDLCFGTACHPVEEWAIRAALKELLQMEFGLDVVHYRRRNGADLSKREQAMLARASRLRFNDCTALLTPAGQPVAPAHFDDRVGDTMIWAQLRSHLTCVGIAAHGIELMQTDDAYQVLHAILPALRMPQTPAIPPPGQDQRWTEWDLY